MCAILVSLGQEQKMTERNTYTQREWDRTVGWGTVPEEYKTPEHKPEDEDEEDSEE